MSKFNGTLEIINSKRGIITLHTLSGDWAGSCRLDAPRGDLYERGYRLASQNAAVKGGTLETYRVVS